MGGAYTAILLSQAPGKVLWHTALLPVLFLVGGLISGTALVMLISAVRGQGEVSAKLGKFLAGLLLLEVGMILAEILVLMNGGPEAVTAAKTLLSGEYSFLFWVVEIILGAVIPGLILFRNRISISAQTVASILILVGIFSMRYIIVIGGQTLG